MRRTLLLLVLVLAGCSSDVSREPPRSLPAAQPQTFSEVAAQATARRPQTVKAKPSWDDLAAELAASDQLDRDLAEGFERWRANARAPKSEQAEVLSYMAATGMSPEWVASNLPALRSSVSREQLREAFAQHPRLSELARGLD